MLLAQAFIQAKDIELHELRRNLSGRVSGLEQYTVDVSGLKAFIMRLTGMENNDQQWLESVLTFLGHKATDKWLDTDQDQAEYRLTEFSKKINDLQKLRTHYEKQVRDIDFDVFLLSILRKGYSDYDEVITVNKKQDKAVKEITSEIIDKFKGITDKNLRLVALAKITDELLGEHKESQKTGNKNIDTDLSDDKTEIFTKVI